VILHYHSPLPPAPTGVADYSCALIPFLRRFFDLQVCDAASSVEPSPPGASHVSLYHLGNNALHLPMHRLALARPGVLVLHDALLHHLYLGALDEATYLQEFTYNYGAETYSLAQAFYRDRACSASDERYFRYPMLRRVAESARGVIVHNSAAAEAVKRHAPHTPVFQIPHLWIPPPRLPSPSDIADWRRTHSIAPEAFLFGVFGHLRETKRIRVVLQALERVQSRCDAPLGLLLAGSFVSSTYERAILAESRHLPVVRLGFLPDAAFWAAASAVDACVNLRYPSAGETSGIAIRLMGLGKTVILTEGPEISDSPEDACIRVDAGAAELPMLTEYMHWLVTSSHRPALAIGHKAASHIRAHHSGEQAARMYWRAILACAG
jgi:glycosyltransferase involved in cell wall biosynthesis